MKNNNSILIKSFYLAVFIKATFLLHSCSPFYKTNPFLFSFDSLEKKDIEGTYCTLPVNDSIHDLIITKMDSIKHKIISIFGHSGNAIEYDSCYGYFNNGIMILDHSFNSKPNEKFKGNIWWFVKYGEMIFFVTNEDIKYVQILISRGLDAHSTNKYFKWNNNTFNLWNNKNNWKGYFEK